jgi:HEAT repeat protein
MYYFTYVIRNTGDKPFAFVEGGDYRGGRSESHEITAVDAGGRPVPRPEMFHMGGLVGIRRLRPGEVYTKCLPVERRLTFGGPGVYRVTGRRTLRFSATQEEAVYQLTRNETLRPATLPAGTRPLEVPTENSFPLTIHPYSRERMARLVTELATQIAGYGNLAAKPVEFTEPEGLTPANRLHLDLKTLVKIPEPQAVDQLVDMTRTGPSLLRVAAVKCLGRRTEPQALAAILRALDSRDADLQAAAAEALGTLGTAQAVDILVEHLGRAEPDMAAALLRAMGRTRSPKVIELLSRSLAADSATVRRAAASGLASFGSPEAIALLKTCVADPDMDFREMVVRLLAESLGQPIDARWLVPVVQSRKGKDSIGDVPRVLRLYAGAKAVPALLSCLDFADPSIRSYYNYTIIDQQGACQGGLRIPWICDLNRDGSAAELEHNRWVLRAIRAWVDHYYAQRMDEEQIPALQYWEHQEKYWGESVDGIDIRIRCDQHVWPEGMPQVLQIDVRDARRQGSINLTEPPAVLQVELNGQLYERQPSLTEPTTGIDGGYPKSFHDLVLDDGWRGVTDNQPLQLTPGLYTLTVRLSMVPEARRTGLAASQAVQFEIIAVK